MGEPRGEGKEEMMNIRGQRKNKKMRGKKGGELQKERVKRERRK